MSPKTSWKWVENDPCLWSVFISFQKCSFSGVFKMKTISIKKYFKLEFYSLQPCQISIIFYSLPYGIKMAWPSPFYNKRSIRKIPELIIIIIASQIEHQGYLLGVTVSLALVKETVSRECKIRPMKNSTWYGKFILLAD